MISNNYSTHKYNTSKTNELSSTRFRTLDGDTGEFIGFPGIVICTYSTCMRVQTQFHAHSLHSYFWEIQILDSHWTTCRERVGTDAGGPWQSRTCGPSSRPSRSGTRWSCPRRRRGSGWRATRPESHRPPVSDLCWSIRWGVSQTDDWTLSRAETRCHWSR